MAREVQAIHARFTGDTSDLDGAVKRSETRLRRFQNSVRDVGRAVGRMSQTASVATGVIAATGTALLRTADEMGKSAQAAGVTTDQLQELRFAFGQVAGTTNRQVDQALQRFSVALGEARDGTAEYKDTLDALGVSLKNDTPAALEETLKALSRVEDDADRAAAASALFGTRAGPRLAGALKGGTEAVDALRDAIQRDGGVISAENIDNAEAFNDQMDRLSKIVTADLANTMLENADALGSLAEGLGDVAGAAVDGLGALASFGSRMGRGLALFLAAGEQQEIIDRLGTGGPNRSAMLPGSRVPTPAPGSEPAGGGGPVGAGGGSEEFMVPEGSGQGLAFGAIADAAAGLEQLREESQARLEELQQRYMTEEELLAETKANELAIVQEALKNQQLTEEEGRQLVEEIEKGHMDELKRIRESGMTDLDRITQQSFARQASWVAGYLADMTAATSTENRAMFEINKAAALANAALDAKEAITGAYKVGARIGGPPLGAAFAAAAGAAQAAQIAAIAGQSFGSGVAPSVGATSAPAVEVVGQGGGPAGGGATGAQSLTVRGLDRDSLFDGDTVRRLADQLLEFQRDGGRVVLQDT